MSFLNWLARRYQQQAPLPPGQVSAKRFSRIYPVNVPGLSRLGLLLTAFIVSLLVWSVVMTFSETTQARGTVISSAGEAQIRARVAGTLVDIPVKLGQRVEKNQVLFTVAQDYGGQQGSVPAFEAARYRQEQQEAQTRIEELAQSVTQLKDNLQQQQLLIDRQIATARIKIRQNRALVSNTRATLEAWQKMQHEGYVAHNELNKHNNDYLNAELNLQQEESGLLQLKSNQRELADNHKVQFNELANQSLSLRNRISEIERTLASRGSKTLSMLAPASGYVVAINFPPGHAVGQENEVVMVVRQHLNSPLEGYIYIPSSGAGRIREGERVRVHFDAWPVDKYGAVNARLKAFYPVSVDAKSALLPLPQGQSWYLARIDLPASFIDADRQTRLIMDGMTFSADVVLDTRPVIALLIAPLNRIRTRFLGYGDA